MSIARSFPLAFPSFTSIVLTMVLGTAMVAAGQTLTMVSPSNGGTTSGTITMSVSLSTTSGVNSVGFFRAPYAGGNCEESSATEISWVNMSPLASTTSISFDTTSISNGTYCFYAIAYTGGSPIASNIVWDTNSNALGLTMLSPASGARISGTNSTVSVSLTTTSGVSTVNFYRAPYTPTSAACDENSATEIGSAPASSTTSIGFNTESLSNGTYCFYAVTSGSAPSAASNIVFPVVSNVPASCTPVSSMATDYPSNFNMLQGFTNDNPVEPATSFFSAGGWANSWYFINLGYLGFVDLMSSPEYVSQNPTNNIPDYILFYIQNVNADYSIGPIPQTDDNPDSDDSFAATFLSLSAAYYRVTCNSGFFSQIVQTKNVGNVTVLQALKNIATNNLVNPRMSLNGGSLVRVFQSAEDAGTSGYYNVALVEDNSEDYEGLMDFGNLLTALGDSSASTYFDSAAQIPAAVAGTYTLGEWDGVPGFENAVQDSSGVVSVDPQGQPQFYPTAVSGVYPQLHEMAGLPESMFIGGWNFLQTYFPNYTTYNDTCTDPWTLLGLADAYNGDPTTANTILTNTRSQQSYCGSFTLYEWGFYRRTALYLQNGFVY
jgi:hypothetical protein